MSFKNEIEDFAKMMGVGSEVVERIKTRKRAEEELAWRQEDTALQRRLEREKFDTQKEQYDRTMQEGTRRWDQDFDYRKTTDDRTFNEQESDELYQRGRDKLVDTQTQLENEKLAQAEAERLEKKRVDDITAAITANPELQEYYGDYPYVGKQPPGATAPATGGATALPATPNAPTAPAPTTALPSATSGATVTPERAAAAEEPQEPMGGPEDARRGATVKAEEAGPGPEPGTLNPAVSAATAAVAAPALAVGVNPKQVSEALNAGLKYLQNHFGLDKEGVPGGTEHTQKVQKLVNGEGAWTPEQDDLTGGLVDAEDIKNGVDPKQFNQGQKQLRKMLATYNLLLQGGPERKITKETQENAAAAAAGIIQMLRQQSAMLSMQAEKQIEDGDIEGAKKTVAQAISLAPDQRSVDYNSEANTFVYRDEGTGKVVAEGEATPEMVLAAVKGIKNGSLFYEALMDKASEYDEKYGPPKDERETMDGAVGAKKKTKADAAADAAEDANTADGGAVPVLEEGEAPAELTPTSVPANVPEGATVNDKGELVDKEGKVITGSPTGERSAHEFIDDQLMTANIDGNKDRPLVPAGLKPHEVVKMMGPENMAALKNLTNSVMAHNPKLTAEEAAAVAMSLTDPEGMIKRKPGARPNWNFTLNKNSTPNDPNGKLIIHPEVGPKWIVLPASDAPRIFAATRGQERLVRGGADVRLTEQEKATTATVERRKGETTDQLDKMRSATKGEQAEKSAQQARPGAGAAIEQAKEAVTGVVETVKALPETLGTGRMRGTPKEALPTKSDGRSTSPRTRQGPAVSGGRGGGPAAEKEKEKKRKKAVGK